MNNKYRILHLEDVASDAELVARELKENNISFDYLVVDSEGEYIKALNQFSPDIILSDHSLPAFNSIEAFKILKAQKLNIPFIIISATLTEEVAVTMVREGVDDYILKDRLKRLPHALVNAIEKFRFEKERKQLINEVQDKEALSKELLLQLSGKLLLATKVSGIGIWEYLLEENKFIADDVLLSQYGITSDEFIGTYESWMQYIHPDDKNRVNAEFKNALIKYSDFDTEFRVIWPDGSIHHIEGVAVVQRDKLGNPSRFIGTSQNITERKNAERQKEFEKIDKEALINSTDDAIWSVTKDLKLIAANKSFIRRIKATVGVTLGLGDYMLNPELYRANFLVLWEAFYKKALIGKSFKEELQVPAFNNGMETWLEISFNPIYTNDIVVGIACYSRNITEEKLAAEKIKESEARLAVSQSVAKVGSWETDLTNLDVIWSDEACRIFGVDFSLPHTSHENFLKFVHPDDKEKMEEAFKNSFRSDTLNSVEHRILTEEGIIKEVEQRWHITTDEMGKPLRAIGTVQDITERKKAEKAVKESEAKYRAFFENSMDGILLTTTDGRILAVNPAACKMFRMTEQEICAAGRFGIVDVTDPRVEKLIHKRQGKAQGELTYLRKDGTTFPGEISSVLFTDSIGQERTSMIIRDISERKEADEILELTSSELQYALNDLTKIMNSSLDVICAVDENGIFKKVSAASEAVWGYKPEELIGKQLFDFVYHEDNESTQQTAAQVMTGKSFTNFENRYIRKDGSLVNIEWTARWDANDKMRYGVARDVTEKKRSEKIIEIERQRFYDLFLQAPFCMGILKGPEHVYEMVNELYLQLIGKKNIIGKKISEVRPEVEAQGFIGILDKVYETGITFSINETPISLYDENEKLIERFANLTYEAHWDVEGKIDGIFFFAIDVTEQVVSRKKIEESEKRYRQIIETAEEGIWLVDENNKTTFVNNKMCEILEYTQEEMMGKEIYAFMDDEGKKIAAGLMQKKLEGYSDTIQFKYISKSGKEVWTNISVNPIFSDKATYNGALAMVTDITEKKLAEMQLIESHAKYKAIIDNTINAFLLSDAAGKILDVNETACNLLSYTKQELLQLSRRDVFELEASDYLKAVDERKKTGIASGEVYVITKTGKRVPIAFTTSVFYTAEGEERLSSIGVDITDKKLAEDKIKKSHERFVNVSKATFDAVWDWDIKTKQLYLGDGFRELFGYQVNENENFTTWSQHIHPEDRANIIKNRLNKIVQNDQLNWKDEYRYIRSDGSTAYVSDRGILLKNDEGTYRMIGAMQDITDLKENELAITDLNKNLKKQADDLAVSNEELERFAYVTSHDLQEPLRMVTSFLQLLQKKYDSQLDETAQKYIHFAVDGAGRMKTLILDLLEFSRISSVKVPHTNIDLNDIVTKSLKALKQVIDESGAIINISILPHVCGNEFQLMQLFQNLISNAIKYRDGEAPEIKIGYTESANHWQFYVKDNGIGIDEKFFEKIFIIFQRLHNKNEFNGTGIGLAICKKIAEMHGGKIWLKSSKNNGSTFYFTIDKKTAGNGEAGLLCDDNIN